MSTRTQRETEARRIANGPYLACPADLVIYGERPARIYRVRGFVVYVYATAGTLTKADVAKQIADEIDQIERYGEPLNGAGGAGEW